MAHLLPTPLNCHGKLSRGVRGSGSLSARAIGFVRRAVVTGRRSLGTAGRTGASTVLRLGCRSALCRLSRLRLGCWLTIAATFRRLSRLWLGRWLAIVAAFSWLSRLWLGRRLAIAATFRRLSRLWLGRWLAIVAAFRRLSRLWLGRRSATAAALRWWVRLSTRGLSTAAASTTGLGLA